MTRVSRVVLSDEEVANAVRDANDGKPAQWVEDAVTQEMRERRDLQRYQQNAYHPEARTQFEQVTTTDPESGVSATYTKPKVS